MRTVRVSVFLTDKILVSRESARILEEPLRLTMQEIATNGKTASDATVTIDFEGIAGVAPSFMDELLVIFESHVGDHRDACNRSVLVANPPTRLSSKFEAIARGHTMTVEARADGSWLLTSTDDHRS